MGQIGTDGKATNKLKSGEIDSDFPAEAAHEKRTKTPTTFLVIVEENSNTYLLN
jgi:hypothetical protein